MTGYYTELIAGSLTIAGLFIVLGLMRRRDV